MKSEEAYFSLSAWNTQEEVFWGTLEDALKRAGYLNSGREFNHYEVVAIEDGERIAQLEQSDEVSTNENCLPFV